MKYENWIYGLGSVAVIAGAVMKILHFPNGNLVFGLGLIVVFLFQMWHMVQLKKQGTQLKKRIKELENK